MKKFIVMVLGVLSVFTLAACEREEAESSVIFDEDEGRFELEEGAEIQIGVDSDDLGQAIVDQWEEDYPEHADVLSATNYDSVNSESGGMEGLELMEDEAPDVALVIDNEVIGREPAARNLHEYFPNEIFDQTNPIQEDINQLGDFYLPAFYDGMVFSWNATMLEELGVDTDDVTQNNLPAELSTWEDIFQFVEDEYGTESDERPEFEGNTIREFFPVSLAEAWSGYPQLSTGGWQIYGEGDYTDPEFDSPEFLAGLEFLEEFSNTNMSVDETGEIRSSGEMDWRWENYLEGDYPLGLVGTWMDIDGQMEDTGYDFRFSTMPTYDDMTPATLYKTKGFVINAATEYPSAANEVLRWLYTENTQTTMINNSAYLPAVEDDAEIFPTIEEDYKQGMTEGLQHSHLEPAETLPNNPSVRAMSVYYNIGVEDYMMELWDGALTPQETQDAIADAADSWIEDNNTLD